MVCFDRAHPWHLPSAIAIAALATPMPALAQDEPSEETLAGEAAVTPDTEVTEEQSPPETDILSPNTLSLIVDLRIVLADGHQSWIEGGFGKTRFDGTTDGDLQLHSQPVEGSLIWQPQFTRTLNANVSAAWQAGFDDLQLAVYTGQPFYLSVDGYERLLARRSEAWQYLEHHRLYLEGRRLFCLHRAGDEERDSRVREGLGGTVSVTLDDDEVDTTSTIRGSFEAHNTGANRWLPSDATET
jgi:hypothetical protein